MNYNKDKDEHQCQVKKSHSTLLSDWSAIKLNTFCIECLGYMAL